MAVENNGEALSLPIIDVSSSDSQTAKDILDAASRYGFVFIKNYESYLSSEQITAMFSLVVLSTGVLSP